VTVRRAGILAAVLAAAAAGAALAARLLKRGEDAAGPPPPPSPPTPAERSAVEGYCVKERKKVEIAEPRAVKTKNGRDAIRGRCPDCGAAMFRMGNLPGA
jgi:hypothetical protein